LEGKIIENLYREAIENKCKKRPSLRKPERKRI